MTESVFSQEVIRTDIDPSELHAIAEKSATAILLKIKDREKNIRSAEDAAKKAASIKTGLIKFGNTDKKLDATANALVQTNAALVEMNDLIQESIKFTCSSIQFAQVMHKTMARLMVSGFKDANGNIQQLAGESKDFVQLILDEAEDFVYKQRIFEGQHAELQKRLDKNEEVDAEQTQRLEDLQTTLSKQGELIHGLFKRSRLDRIIMVLSLLLSIACIGAHAFIRHG